ncbi:hypothetical protein A2160_01180 [Candidatus Beckwithbacteria bacterium RBG_13_42_9]|uniref:PIN domain-containing protein n=1 Tax=Candidatus Beckwithbacteria bacterium RBG_13_42_9 TaxID=1797457 RepID=A0A1F5E3H0_9BACT|nr:MAG: hypothetical protein A2160_01180 [Candidatus Beckwithbacteria bacterium RBG_13_42_9]
MVKVLLDADALIALAKPDDSNHQKAIGLASSIKQARIYTTPFTIPEATTVISYKLSQTAAKKFLIENRKKKFIELKLTPSIVQKADEVFIKQRAKGTSWIDCLNVAIAQAYRLDKIFSFDHFYQKWQLLLKI